MRTVHHHLMEEKMDEAVTHYIDSHHQNEAVNVDGGTLGMSIQDPSRIVTVMHSNNLQQMCRQGNVNDQVHDGPWNEELDGKLAALVAQLAQHSRISNHQNITHTKVVQTRPDDEPAVLMETPLRHFTSQPLETQSSHEEVSSIPPLPSLPAMKRIPPTTWFHSKSKDTLKDSSHLLDEEVLELETDSSPAPHRQQNRKSLPHKKRISRKLKRNTAACNTQEDSIVVINCAEEVQQEEILPDSFVATNDPEHHAIIHEMRAILICQICGDFYGEEQLKFYQHLKQHYEPHATIIIENPVADLAMDKMSNTCIVDNVAQLPDSIVELSLENTMPKTTMYQPMDKHVLYTTANDKLGYNKVHYTMAADKEVNNGDERVEYESLEKIELYSCTRCNKSFRKQKNCEQHIKDAHCKLDDMSEFSEPEDLMAGIHVAVEEPQYDGAVLPHLTVDSGHVHQDPHRHWYSRGSSNSSGCAGGECYCYLCVPRNAHNDHADSHHNLKEEIIQRIFDVEVSTSDNANFPTAILNETLPVSSLAGEVPHEAAAQPAPRGRGRGAQADAHAQIHSQTPLEIDMQHHQLHEEAPDESQEVPDEADKKFEIEESLDKKKRKKTFQCPECPRVFNHRNSVVYHVLSHKGKKAHECKECDKSFYTSGALKVHIRVHSGQRPYKCKDCPREFRQWGDLKYHVISIHTDEKNYKCEFCGKEFARKYSLNVHRRIHTGERNYPCTVCGKTFRAASYRTTHLRTHTGYKPYKCPVCGKAFRINADVRRHLVTHDKVKREPKNKSNKSSEIKLEQADQPPSPTEDALNDIDPKAKSNELKISKKPKPNKPKKTSIKKGAPNVVITNNRDDVIPKNNIHYTGDYDRSKYRDTYPEEIEPNQYQYQSEKVTFETPQENRQFALLKPIYRTDDIDTEKAYVSPQNTDGKMTVFTHIEKSRGATGGGSLNELRENLELRESRGETPAVANENGFIERLTALYNIPTV